MKRLALAALSFCACTSVGAFPPGADWQPAATPAWAHQQRFAITDNRSDLISVVNVAPSPQLLANIPVGDIPVELEGPHHLIASPDGAFLYYNLSNYVPGSGLGPHGSHGSGAVPGSLVKLDAHTMTKLGEVLVDRSPGDVILSTHGDLAYVTHYDLLRVLQVQASPTPKVEDAYSSIAVIDTKTMVKLSLTPVCITAHGEGLSADGKMLYVTCAQSDEVAVVDVSNPSAPVVKARVPVGPNPNLSLGNNGAYGPYALSVSPTDGTVWISDNNSADVRVFDPRTMAMDATRTVPVGGVAMFGDFTGDGKTLLVPHQGDDQVTIINTATMATQTVPLPPSACKNVHALRLAADGKLAIVVCEGDHIDPGTVLMMSVVPPVVTGYVSVGVFPDGAAWLPPAP